MQARILIPDFGMGNLHSVERSLHRMNVVPVISSDPAEIKKADKIILPGVGHFKKAMENLKALNLIEELNEAVLIKKKPVLGICLGLQLMTTKSEEGNINGLGWIDASVVKFSVQDTLTYKVPHIGWNKIKFSKKSNLTNNIPDLSEFYFLHSYHLVSNNKEDVLSETNYEYNFTSAIEKNNIWGVQFHPEKSHSMGNTLLNNFISL
ncbi:MAG: imidazole glycerol phosphate synthase subunit HisH [Chitinophagaceae bacterium]